MLSLREGVGMPEPAIEQLYVSPPFAGLVPLAQTTVYDNRLLTSVSTPTTKPMLRARLVTPPAIVELPPKRYGPKQA